ncbi:hypothetical protein [Anoxynatronum sibiricum]|uniref:Uncharacterized protein n=1 Tax=Anoxynatronum sibiricum TaxID=210623 RepID=A0ABU9VX83_9CLOT
MAANPEWVNAKCDRYDYFIAGFSGVAAGLIDIFFVGMPGASSLGSITDAQADGLVKQFAKLKGWSPREGNEDSVASAIGFLEKEFPVNYDHRHTVDVGGAFKMGTKNHHYKSLAHSPDIIGLFFSILDQFQGKASFLSDGQLIRIDSEGPNLRLHGGSFPAKIFCGFCNWIGHIMSDLAGSSGGRGSVLTGRGSGVPVPFMPLFQLCDFGEFQVGQHRQTLAKVMTQVFQNGYDARFGAAMAIPVLVNELIIRTLWVIKQRFYHKRPWSECFPSEKHADLRMMLLVGHGALCLMDGADAAIRSGGNAVVFFLRLNLVAWARFMILVFKELRIRYGEQVLAALKAFLGTLDDVLTPGERKLLLEYRQRMNELDLELSKLLEMYMKQVYEDYLLFHAALESSFDQKLSSDMRGENSIALAERCKVDDKKIIKSDQDLDDFFTS